MPPNLIDLDQQVREIRGGAVGSPGAPFLSLAGGTMAGPLILNADPTTALGAATKQYVDAATNIVASCRLATAAALPTGIYTPIGGGVGDYITITATGVLTIDGQAVGLGDRILVKNQVSTNENGIYTCTTAGASGVQAVLTRATDFDQSSEITGAYTFVTTGTANTNSGWIVSSAGPFTVGVTAITFSSFSGVGGGPFLPLTGGTISGNLNVSGSFKVGTPTLTTSTSFGLSALGGVYTESAPLGLCFTATQFGANASLDLRRVNGTVAAGCTPVQSGQIVAGFHAGASVDTPGAGIQPALVDIAQIQCVATENYSFTPTGGASGFGLVGVTTDTAADTFTYTAHGLNNGDAVILQSLSLTTGISNGTYYYVVGKTANTFQLALTAGGAAINLTGSNDSCYVSNGISGNKWDFYTALNGTNAKQIALTLDNDKSAVFTGAFVPPTAAGFSLQTMKGVAGIPGWQFQRINGTLASPTAVTSGQQIAAFGFYGQYDTTVGHINQGAQILVKSTQAFTSANFGSQMLFQLANNTSSALATVLTLDQDQSATFTGAVTITGALTTGSYNPATLNIGSPYYTAATGGLAAAAPVLAESSSGFGLLFVGSQFAAIAATIDLRCIKGTIAAGTTPITSGTTLGGMHIGSSNDTVAALGAPSLVDNAQIYCVSTENYSTSASGSKWDIYTTANGTNVKSVAVTIGQDKSLTANGNIIGSTLLPPVAYPSAGLAFMDMTGVAAIPGLRLIRVNGTLASPTALTNAQTFGDLVFDGQYDTTPGDIKNGAVIAAQATAAWTSSSAGGAKLVFQTLPNGSATIVTALTLDQDQSATFAGAVSGITTLAIGGALSGVTSLAMTAGITGLTTISASGLVTTSGNLSTTGSGTLTVAGAATLSSTLGVTGAATLTDLTLTPTTSGGAATATMQGIAGFPFFNLIRINGTVGSPTAITNGQILGELLIGGQYDTTVGHTKGGALILASATAAWSAAATGGGKLTFQTLPNASASFATALVLDQDQSAAFSGNVGFYGVTPVAQPATVAVAPAGGTGTAAGGWDTAAHRDAAIATINACRTALRAVGLMA